MPVTARSAGIILHPTSLPGPYGIGDLGPEADRFLDWAAAAGQSVWQVLPLGPTGYGNSPYVGLSAFAGNPLLIAPDLLVAEGLLPAASLDGAPAASGGRVAFDAAIDWKGRILRRSFEEFRASGGGSGARAALDAFRAAPERAGWLADWALFAALKERHGSAAWHDWPPDLKRREPSALARAAKDLAEEIEFHVYVQFLFARQWSRVRGEAARRGIRILGDAPIYVALDSADVWVDPSLFQLDDDLRPIAVAGVPPDYFSETGQLWGNPLYRWDRMEADGFAWWIRRVRAEGARCDLLRIDHFRGFASYWSIPAGDETAERGHWVPGPRMRLFDALRAALGDLPLVAEDLGEVTPDVPELLRDTGLPGMRVLQFGFDSWDSQHAPHRYPERCVAYTGTHDNDTALGWFAGRGAAAREAVLDYVGGAARDVAWAMIRALYVSAAERAIVPVQDPLELGSEARMNLPARAEGNWAFRVPPGALTPECAARLRRLAELSGRARPA
ncbi:MAG TPA: 4-alpha-glucanotransferase [Candidatus Eisenbacteria bacterium]